MHHALNPDFAAVRDKKVQKKPVSEAVRGCISTVGPSGREREFVVAVG